MIAKNTGTLTIGGEDRPYQVSTIRQDRALTDTTGIELGEIQAVLAKLSILHETKQLTAKAILDALPTITAYAWSALYAGAMSTHKKCDFTYENVQEWVEDSEMATIVAELLKPLLTLGEVYTEKKSGTIG